MDRHEQMEYFGTEPVKNRWIQLKDTQTHFETHASNDIRKRDPKRVYLALLMEKLN